jgi:hypothetical protein
MSRPVLLEAHACQDRDNSVLSSLVVMLASKSDMLKHFRKANVNLSKQFDTIVYPSANGAHPKHQQRTAAEEYWWRRSGQAPAMLRDLMFDIGPACITEGRQSQEAT